jgi:hypothetical protein
VSEEAARGPPLLLPPLPGHRILVHRGVPGVPRIAAAPRSEPPDGCPAGVRGCGAGRCGPRPQVCRPHASLPPPGVAPAGDIICGFVLSVPTPGILLSPSPGTAWMPGRSRRRR